MISVKLLRLFVTVAMHSYNNDFKMMGGLSQPEKQQWIVLHQQGAGLETFQTTQQQLCCIYLQMQLYRGGSSFVESGFALIDVKAAV